MIRISLQRGKSEKRNKRIFCESQPLMLNQIKISEESVQVFTLRKFTVVDFFFSLQKFQQEDGASQAMNAPTWEPSQWANFKRYSRGPINLAVFFLFGSICFKTRRNICRLHQNAAFYIWKDKKKLSRGRIRRRSPRVGSSRLLYDVSLCHTRAPHIPRV